MADIPEPLLRVEWDRLQGWRNQYDRMHRWHERLGREISDQAQEGDWNTWPEGLWDTAWAFFQSAYHLKDWILREHPKHRRMLENAISANQRLALCADICNGTKHGRVDRHRRVPTNITGLREFAPNMPSQTRWLVLGPDGPINLEILASDVLRAWESLVSQLPGLAAERPEGKRG